MELLSLSPGRFESQADGPRGEWGANPTDTVVWCDCERGDGEREAYGRSERFVADPTHPIDLREIEKPRRDISHARRSQVNGQNQPGSGVCAGPRIRDDLPARRASAACPRSARRRSEKASPPRRRRGAHPAAAPHDPPRRPRQITARRPRARRPVPPASPCWR